MINKSIINSNNVNVEQILVPIGISLTGPTGSIPPYKSSVAYNLTDDKLKYGNGTNWIPLITSINDYTAVVPQVATDQNVLLINNTTNQIATQIADATHNGIVTATTQTLGGLKQFPDTVGIGAIIGGNISNIISTYYKTIAPIAITWDPSGILFSTGAKTSTVTCERIGNMIYIQILGIQGFPLGTPENITSNVGVIPAQFRPATNQLSMAITINGYQDPTATLQMTSGQNTLLGACILDTAGTITFGTTQGVRIGTIDNGGTLLYPFQGPLEVGFVKQTLAFSAL